MCLAKAFFLNINFSKSFLTFLVIGNGFFTMKHKWSNLRDKFTALYSENDSFSYFRIIFDEIPRFNQTYFDNFFNLNRKPAEKRLEQLTEHNMFDNLFARSEQSKN